MIVGPTRQLAECLRMLRAVEDDLGCPVPDVWRRRIIDTPRAHFLPETIWVSDEDPHRPVTRSAEPAEWLRLAYADAPVVTQVNDGVIVDDLVDAWASSSASAPAIVVRMLMELDLKPGHRVLEIGTGTGWNAALLARAVGARHVVTVEIDEALATRARRNLTAAGLPVLVVAGDGALGSPDAGPFDRVIATCSVRVIPPSWMSQSTPGARILTPWESPWCSYGLLRLVVDGAGGATGRFSPHGSFMLMRGQRIAARIYRDIVRDEHQPQETSTTLDPTRIAGNDFDAQFCIGLRLSDVWHVWDHEPEIDGIESRLWLATLDGSSWAAVDTPARGHEFTVRQFGPRRLWDEASAAWAWYVDHQEPAPSRLGLSVDAHGRHTAWLDEPSGESWPLGVG